MVKPQKEFFIVTHGDKQWTPTNQRELNNLVRDLLMKNKEITIRIRKVTT